jgi:hypothetical protein
MITKLELLSKYTQLKSELIDLRAEHSVTREILNFLLANDKNGIEIRPYNRYIGTEIRFLYNGKLYANINSNLTPEHLKVIENTDKYSILSYKIGLERPKYYKLDKTQQDLFDVTEFQEEILKQKEKQEAQENLKQFYDFVEDLFNPKPQKTKKSTKKKESK